MIGFVGYKRTITHGTIGGVACLRQIVCCRLCIYFYSAISQYLGLIQMLLKKQESLVLKLTKIVSSLLSLKLHIFWRCRLGESGGNTIGY